MTMRSRAALAAAFSLLVAAPTLAADNYTIQSGGAARAIRAKDVGGVLTPMSIAVDGTGIERFTGTNPATVQLPSGTVLAISAAALPLPAGASTSANQATANGSLASIDGKLTGSATAAAQATGNGSLASIATNTTGLATAAAQTTGNGSLASIVAGVGAPADATWDGAAASATHTSILKSIWAKLSGLLSVDTVVRSTSADRSGTLTAGGTAQQIMAANTSRRGFLLQNQSTGDLYVNCLATASASQTSLKIPAGALYESSPHHSGTGACSIFGATTAQAWYGREF